MNKKTRNPIARMAIMGKGGVHEKTTKAKRQQEKQALKNKIRAERFGSSFIYAFKIPSICLYLKSSEKRSRSVINSVFLV